MINYDKLDELALEDDQVDLTDLKMIRLIKEYRFASFGAEGWDKIKTIGIMGPLMYFFEEFNPSNNAPYHNLYHTRCMVLNCFEAGAHMNLNSGTDLTTLLMAALFHDFDHTAGSAGDDVNIPRAIRGLTNGLKYARSQGFNVRIVDMEEAIELIKITKYPYEAEPDTLLEAIIRDADLMQPYEEDPIALVKQFRGLKSEIEVRTGSILNFAESLHTWYREHATWYSPWGESKSKVLDYAKRLDNLKELLNGRE